MPRRLAARVVHVDQGAGADLGAQPAELDADLRVQALRLPGSARALLDVLVRKLNGGESDRTSGGAVTRGLVLLALYCEKGRGGTRLAQAFRLAASDPTEQGVRKALEELRQATDATDTDPEPTRRSA